MLQLFEGYRRISIASIMRYWNANGVLGIGGKSLDALASLDPQKVFATCQAYPLRRQLRGWGKIATDPEEGEGLYDPVFVMGLFVASMHEGMRGLDWVEVLRSNVLGLTVCGLSSRDKEVRSVASYALAKTMSLIETTGFFERAQLTYTLRLLRHALPTSTSRLPILSTLFFAYALRSLANPSHFFYPLSSRFLLQRSVFDSEDTPLLYGMLYANGEGWKRERNWMVRFLKEGVRSEADWRVIRRRKVWSLMATLFIESLDPVFRRSILQVWRISRATKQPLTSFRPCRIFFSSLLPPHRSFSVTVSLFGWTCSGPQSPHTTLHFLYPPNLVLEANVRKLGSRRRRICCWKSQKGRARPLLRLKRSE